MAGTQPKGQLAASARPFFLRAPQTIDFFRFRQSNVKPTAIGSEQASTICVALAVEAVMTNMQRDFTALLDELLATDAARESVAAPSVAVDILSVVEELGHISVTGKAVEDEYREMSSPDLSDKLDSLFEAVLEKQPAPEPEPSTDPDDISRELGLGSGKRAEELARLRRSFAFRNHPDRVAPHMRERAMTRMKVANMLIDEARQRAAARPNA